MSFESVFPEPTLALPNPPEPPYERKLYHGSHHYGQKINILGIQSLSQAFETDPRFAELSNQHSSVCVCVKMYERECVCECA